MATAGFLPLRSPTPRRRDSRFASFQPLKYRATWFFLGVLIFGAFSEVFLGSHLLTMSERMQREELATRELRPQFILFGDSITQASFRSGGWGAALQDHYARKADVVLRGYGGYNTRWALFLLDRIFGKGPSPRGPALVTVFFGANDAALPDRSSKRQHVPLAEYKQNLRTIAAHIRGVSADTKIVFITPPPIDEDARREYARATYGDKAVEAAERTNEVTQQYAAACVEVGASLRLPVVDLWTRVQEEASWQSLLSDGLHLAEGGNQLLFNELLALLQGSTDWSPSLKQEEMPWDFPVHTQIDEEEPARTFASLYEHRSGFLP